MNTQNTIKDQAYKIFTHITLSVTQSVNLTARKFREWASKKENKIIFDKEYIPLLLPKL